MHLSLPLGAISFAGYSALIERYQLAVPLPDRLFAIHATHQVQHASTWSLLTPRHTPSDDLFGHLTFALKYEGIHLGVLRALFQKISSAQIECIVLAEPTSAYSRRIWFLYEWLMQTCLLLDDVKQGNFVDVVNTKLQYAGPVRKEKRYRINNNLPGCRDFCPLIRKTPALDEWLARDLSNQARQSTQQCHLDLLARAAAFLLLADSKASYVIEGEYPPHTRIERWGQIIGEAGLEPLSLTLLERLQCQVLVDQRFVRAGLRDTGGFIGLHDRSTGMPLPEHISAKAADLVRLLDGLVETYQLLLESDFPPVLLASVVSFGFVFIHPFEDGNGRLHRYLMHHVLAETGFVPQGLVFPVSAVILECVEQYRQVLQAYSKPRLKYIEWYPTPENNVAVTNDTLDLYRYFDATRQAEFLYSCVAYTVEHTLPDEVAYLQKYDEFTAYVSSRIDMPMRLLDLLVRFLQHNHGVLSKRALNKEFAALTAEEVSDLELKYQLIFADTAVEDGE